MERRHSTLMDVMASWPWQLNLFLGAAGFAALWWAAPLWRDHTTSPFGTVLAGVASLPVMPWGWLTLCAITGAASWAAARRRRRLLDTRTGLDSLSATGWRNFERLVGEAFRRQGYSVEETGLGGADGGVDLVLRRDGRRVLVQCKQWKRQQVGVSVVREMYGLMVHHAADAVTIVSSGGFTRDAQRFAQGKPIELMPGSALLAMIRAVQAGTAQATTATPRIEPTLTVASPPPACTRCKAPMAQRHNRQTREAFLGCTRYPACRSTQPL